MRNWVDSTAPKVRKRIRCYLSLGRTHVLDSVSVKIREGTYRLNVTYNNFVFLKDLEDDYIALGPHLKVPVTGFD